jgi:hypothetical protein
LHHVQVEEDSTTRIEVVVAVVVEAEQMVDEGVLAVVGIEGDEEVVAAVDEEGDNKALRPWKRPATLGVLLLAARQ